MLKGLEILQSENNNLILVSNYKILRVPDASKDAYTSKQKADLEADGWVFDDVYGGCFCRQNN